MTVAKARWRSLCSSEKSSLNTSIVSNAPIMAFKTSPDSQRLLLDSDSDVMPT